ncbi:type VII secretion protein EssA [Alkalihalobacterium sp. APHAB7]
MFCILIVSLLLPMSVVLAESQLSTEERGKLNMNLDRISGSKGDQTKTKTELEKVFPELFRDETRELIDRKQLKQEEWLQDLHQSIFEMESQADATVALVQETLFTESYTAPTTQSLAQEIPNEDAQNVLLFSALGFILMVGGVVFTMMRQVVE